MVQKAQNQATLENQFSRKSSSKNKLFSATLGKLKMSLKQENVAGLHEKNKLETRKGTYFLV